MKNKVIPKSFTRAVSKHKRARKIVLDMNWTMYTPEFVKAQEKSDKAFLERRRQSIYVQLLTGRNPLGMDTFPETSDLYVNRYKVEEEANARNMEKLQNKMIRKVMGSKKFAANVAKKIRTYYNNAVNDYVEPSAI